MHAQRTDSVTHSLHIKQLLNLQQEKRFLVMCFVHDVTKVAPRLLLGIDCQKSGRARIKKRKLIDILRKERSEIAAQKAMNSTTK